MSTESTERSMDKMDRQEEKNAAYKVSQLNSVT